MIITNKSYRKLFLYRSFTAHTGRILAMKALLSKQQKIFISSSADRTIKVWDVDNLLENVHPIQQNDLKVEKLLCCSKANVVVSLTRGGLSFWNLQTGNLECRLQDTAGGKIKKIFFFF